MSALAYDRDTILDLAGYLGQHPDPLVFGSLRWWCRHLPHDVMVSLVNEAGLVTAAAACIARAWVLERGFSEVVLEFDSAVCCGSHPGEVLAYRSTKKTWGRLVAVRDMSGSRVAASGEARMRMWFALKENNPIRIKQQTRNELKVALGRGHSFLVGDALRGSKQAFLDGLSSADSDHILSSTQLAPDAFWRAVKNGDAVVSARLGLIPSRDRECMRKRGMYVSAAPQLSLPL